jgi:hypothetical protein
MLSSSQRCSLVPLDGRYGVPACEADAFEEVARQSVYGCALRGCQPSKAKNAAHKALLGKTTMFSPKLLLDKGELCFRSSCLQLTHQDSEGC